MFKVRENYGHYMGVNIPDHIDKLQKYFLKIVNNDSRMWPNPFDDYPYIVLEIGDNNELS